MSRFITILFIIMSFSLQAQMQVDSLLTVWNNSKLHDTVRLNAIGNIYGNIYSNNNYDSCIYYAELQLKFAQTKNLTTYAGNALFGISRAYYFKGNYQKAIESANECYLIKVKTNDKIGVGRVLNTIANAYNAQGNNAKAIEYYTKSLKIRESINDINGVGGSYNNIGNIHLHQGEFKKAIEYYNKALSKFEESKNEAFIAVALSSLGDAYTMVDSTEKAMNYLSRAITVLEKSGRISDIVPTLVSIGNLYTKSKNYNQALENYNKAIALSEKVNDPLILSIALSATSDLYFKQGDFKKAIEYNSKAIENSKKAGYLVKTRDISESLYKSYKAIKNYRDALEMHELFIQSRDSILSENNQKEVMSQEFKYDYEKKALADSLDFINKKKIDDLKHEAELKVEQNQRYALYGGLSLVIIFSLFIFNRFKVTQKQKTIIEHQKHQIVESINYSKKIQASLLPPLSEMQKSIPNLFVFYEPKDIVSGDFYWFKEFEKYTILACVDCTGHGVPGGFMSTLGSLLLDKVVNDEATSASEILSKLSNEIIRILHQQDGGEIQDGMDLSICLIDKENKKIEFSGARNGIIIVSDGVAKRYKADLFPVGGNYLKKDKPVERNFKTHSISILPNDWIYMYTDGFMEQVGGTDNLPMNYSQFENQLCVLSTNQTAEEKIQLLEKGIQNWKGKNKRDDDILIMGFQIG